MNKKCETCIKRKTLFCPTSIKCMATDDKLYYQDKIMLLEENKQLKERIAYLERSNNRREDTILEQRQEISDLDLYLEQRYSMKIFKSRIKQLEEDNYKQYKEIDKLKKENEWLKNHQKIEIVNLNK